MMRTLLLALFLLCVWGCEGYDRTAHTPGPNAAYAEQIDSIPTNARRLQADNRTDWQVAPLPDGRRFVVTDWWETGDLGIRDLGTGEFRRLTHNPAPYNLGFGTGPRVSPDGRRVVYTWIPNGAGNQLRVLDLDGGASRVIHQAKPDLWIYAEDWSPDGHAILAYRRLEDGATQIVLVPAEGGAVRAVKTLDWRVPVRMNFSPDGRFILYDYPTRADSNDGRDLFVLDLETGRETRLAEHPADDHVLGWAPDGRHVLFASDRTGTPGAWLVEVDDGKSAGDPVLVKPDLWRASPGSFTPDGRYFFSVESGNRGIYVASLHPKTGQVIGAASPLEHSKTSGGRPRWSPDGRFLASLVNSGHHAPLGGRLSIAIRSAETGDVRELSLPGDLNYPSYQWAPDGSALFIVAEDKSRRGFYRMDIQTGRTETLLKVGHEERIGTFRIRSDGRTLVYVRSEPAPDNQQAASIIARDLERHAEQVLCRLRKPPLGRRIYPSLSPDASTLASFQRRGEEVDLVVESVEGCDVRTLLSMPTHDVAGYPGITWSHDSRQLFFPRRTSSDPTDNTHAIMRVPLEGGEAIALGLAMRGLGHAEVHPDGSRIVFTGGSEQTELWVMENFLPGRIAAAQEQ